MVRWTAAICTGTLLWVGVSRTGAELGTHLKLVRFVPPDLRCELRIPSLLHRVITCFVPSALRIPYDLARRTARAQDREQAAATSDGLGAGVGAGAAGGGGGSGRISGGGGGGNGGTGPTDRRSGQLAY